MLRFEIFNLIETFLIETLWKYFSIMIFLILDKQDVKALITQKGKFTH